MTIHFSSDHHILHENILKLGDGRPFTTMKDMVGCIHHNWVENVMNDDTIYVLGDAAMGDIEESILFFKGLPGNKFMIPGNHDKNFSRNSKTYVERYAPLYEDAGFTVLPENTHIMLPVSWGEQKVLLSHFPYSENWFGDKKDKYAKNRPVNAGLPLVHGHTHSRCRFSGNPLEFHVGVDANNFTPVNESVVVTWLEDLRVRGRI